MMDSVQMVEQRIITSALNIADSDEAVAANIEALANCLGVQVAAHSPGVGELAKGLDLVVKAILSKAANTYLSLGYPHAVEVNQRLGAATKEKSPPIIQINAGRNRC